MTKMLFIHSSDEMYGADRMLLEFVEALPDGVSAEVWLPNDLQHVERAVCRELLRRGIRTQHIDLPIVRRAYRNPRGILHLANRTTKLRAAVQEAAPDVVYCTTSAALLCAPIARLAGVREVIGHMQEIWTQSDRLAMGQLLRACTRILAISDAVAISAGVRVRPRIDVVENGLPAPAHFTDIGDRSGPLNFLVASRWNAWKGHGTLLRAWDRASTDATLTIVGGPPPSGRSVNVRQLAGGLTRSGSVRVVGEVEDISVFIDDADVIIVPSDRPEPFGLVAVEAFARGRPVLASAAGGLLDIVTDGKDGWLFAVQDVDALAHEIECRERVEVATAGACGRQKYLSTYTQQQFVERWRRAIGVLG